MAKDVIKVSTEAMRDTISQYTAQKTRLMEAFSICVKATNLIDNAWAGTSYRSTRAKMDATWKNLGQAEERMDDAIDELNKVIDIMDNAENTNKTKFSGLDTGTSPFN